MVVAGARTAVPNRMLSAVTVVVLAAVAAIPIGVHRYDHYWNASQFFFEVGIQSSESGHAQVFFDTGKGFRAEDNSALKIIGSDTPLTYRFPIPQGRYSMLRLDPIDRDSSIAITAARILGPGKKILHEFPARRFEPAQDIRSSHVQGDVFMLRTKPHAKDPALLLRLKEPILLAINTARAVAELSLLAVASLLGSWILLWLANSLVARHRAALSVLAGKAAGRIRARPRTAVSAVAGAAAILSCYPVVFCGMSFVSPNSGTPLLYEHFPTLPGYSSDSIEDGKGTDVGAMMWQNRSYSVIQSRAILDDHEFPLWNRFHSFGTTLLGQGLSMIGNPLHALTWLSGGAAWAWDLKFVLAKILFAVGLGLTVHAAVAHVPASMLLAFSSAFIGFFSFRFNHPVFFSVCYSPWILLCWFGLVRASSVRSGTAWMMALLLANWVELNSASVKEAYMLAAGLNSCGAMILLLSQKPDRLWWNKWGLAALGGTTLLMLHAPTWVTFLDCLGKSYNHSQTPTVNQASPHLLIGLFDDIFYRQVRASEAVYLPSANFLILFGCLWMLVRLRQLVTDRIFLAIALGASLPLAISFGLVPAHVIVKIPFVANIAHTSNTFSCVLIVPLTVLAGYGLKLCWEEFPRRKDSFDWILFLLLLGSPLALFFGSTQSHVKSPFFWGYATSLVLALAALPFMIQGVAARRRISANAVVLFLLSLVLLHWRYGLHLKWVFDDYVTNPRTRVNLDAESPAVSLLKAESSEPFRAVGFGHNLFAGYNSAIGIEGIYGADPFMNREFRELAKGANVDWYWDWRIGVYEKTIGGLRPFYDALGVKYYLATARDHPGTIDGLRLTARLDLDVYRSDSAWPRAFFTDTVSSYQSVDALITMLSKEDGRPFAAVHPEDHLRRESLRNLASDQSRRLIVPATDYRLTTNTTSFTVNAPRPGVAVLGEAYWNGDFIATVDGRRTDVIRLNHAFKGVEITEAGEHRISFRYWPRYFTLSLWMAGTGLVILAIWLALVFRSPSRVR